MDRLDHLLLMFLSMLVTLIIVFTVARSADKKLDTVIQRLDAMQKQETEKVIKEEPANDSDGK